MKGYCPWASQDPSPPVLKFPTSCLFLYCLNWIAAAFHFLIFLTAYWAIPKYSGQTPAARNYFLGIFFFKVNLSCYTPCSLACLCCPHLFHTLVKKNSVSGSSPRAPSFGILWPFLFKLFGFKTRLFKKYLSTKSELLLVGSSSSSITLCFVFATMLFICCHSCLSYGQLCDYQFICSIYCTVHGACLHIGTCSLQIVLLLLTKQMGKNSLIMCRIWCNFIWGKSHWW